MLVYTIGHHQLIALLRAEERPTHCQQRTKPI